MFHIIISHIEGNINLGSISRIMNNFNCSRLTLINPKASLTHQETLTFASHSKEILINAVSLSSLSLLEPHDLLIGFSRRSGQFRRKDFDLPDLKLFLEERIFEQNMNVGLLFGNEQQGLSTQEISLCQYQCNIPTTGTLESINLSHAVSIVLYELSQLLTQKNNKEKYTQNITNSVTQFTKLLECMDYFDSEEKKQQLTHYCYKLFSRGIVNKEDALVLSNIFNRLRGKYLQKNIETL